MKNIFEHLGKKYLRIGNRAFPFKSVDKNGVPILKAAEVEDFIDGNGMPSKRVKVECLIIQSSKT